MCERPHLGALRLDIRARVILFGRKPLEPTFRKNSPFLLLFAKSAESPGKANENLGAVCTELASP